MNVNIKPIDFTWPGKENSEALSLELDGSMILQDIISYLAQEMGIPSNITVAQDQLGTMVFPNNQSLNQLQIKSNQEVYLFIQNPQSQILESSLIFFIDDVQQQTSFQISPESTGNDIIQFLIQNQLFDGQYGSMTIRSEQGNQTSNLNEPFSKLGASSTYILYIYTQAQNIPAKVQLYINEEQVQTHLMECPFECRIYDIIQQLIEGKAIKSNYTRIVLKNANGFEQTENTQQTIEQFGRFKLYHLHIYTGPVAQQAQTQALNNQQQQQSPNIQANNQVNNATGQNFTPDILAKSLVVLQNVSLFIDPNSEYIVYRYHQPADIRGILRANKGRELKNIQQGLQFVKIADIQLAEHDDYGFIVKWKNNKCSRVKINLRQ